MPYLSDLIRSLHSGAVVLLDLANKLVENRPSLTLPAPFPRQARFRPEELAANTEVVGRRGVARLTNASPVEVSLDFRTGGMHEMDYAVPFADAYSRELSAWAANAARGPVTRPNAWDGNAAPAVTDACVESLRTGTAGAVKLRPCRDLYSPLRESEVPRR